MLVWNEAAIPTRGTRITADPEYCNLSTKHSRQLRTVRGGRRRHLSHALHSLTVIKPIELHLCVTSPPPIHHPLLAADRNDGPRFHACSDHREVRSGPSDSYAFAVVSGNEGGGGTAAEVTWTARAPSSEPRDSSASRGSAYLKVARHRRPAISTSCPIKASRCQGGSRPRLRRAASCVSPPPRGRLRRREIEGAATIEGFVMQRCAEKQRVFTRVSEGADASSSQEAEEEVAAARRLQTNKARRECWNHCGRVRHHSNETEEPLYWLR